MEADWRELYRATLPDLIRFLHRRVWDAERARDLAQETFVRGLRENPDKPRMWLFSDAARRGVTLDPADDVDRASTARRALEAVDEREREVLLLWEAGLEYREIGEVLDMSVGSVSRTLARARQQLVNQL